MKVELCCIKKHTATNICHYNIKIDDKKYRLIDPGCDTKKEKLKEMALDKDIFFEEGWIIECDLGDDQCELL